MQVNVSVSFHSSFLFSGIGLNMSVGHGQISSAGNVLLLK